MDNIILYTDGSARGNPGNGGYGVVLSCGVHYKELSAGYRRTTNNRMELWAVITGLEALKRPCNVTIYSDSKYVIDTIEKGWIYSWIKTNFKDKKNSDLWKRYLIAARPHTVKFVWVKGHAGNPMNERCDTLATTAADGKELLIDDVFESLGDLQI